MAVMKQLNELDAQLVQVGAEEIELSQDEDKKEQEPNMNACDLKP